MQPEPDRPGAGATEEGRVTLADGRSIAFEVTGAEHAGPPVLVCASVGATLAQWSDFRRALSSRARVIAFDRSGVGQSSSAPLCVTTRAMAREAVAVLDHLRVERALVCGVSIGGMVATWLAVDAPGRVLRLCLAATAAAGCEAWRRAVIGGVPLALCLLRRSADVDPCLMRRILTPSFRWSHREQVHRLEAKAIDHARRFELVKQVIAAARHDARAELDRIQAPALVLAPALDQLIPIEAQRALARRIRGARFEIVPDAGHALTLERPRFVAEKVLGLLHD